MTSPASQIETILREVESLPTLSPVATRLLQIAGVEDADLDALVEIIESDPALSARLLGLCRRADKGLGDRITTVRRAVVMLGLEAVQAAALSVSVYDVMATFGSDAETQKRSDAEDRALTASLRPSVPASVPFDRPGFWRFSIAVATASELIAESHSDLGIAPAEAFVAGLLHGLGKLVLDLLLPRTYSRILGLAERRQSPAAVAESELLGLDHHTAGKRLGEHWRLPQPLRDVMWLYAQPADALPDLPCRNLVGIVAVARTLCRHLHLGWSGDFHHPEPLAGHRGICRPLGLRADLVEAGVARLHEGVLYRSRVLGLGEQSAPELLMQSIAGANQRLGRMASMLEQRARGAQKQTRVLSAIRDFHASLGAIRPSPGLSESIAQVAQSASGILGPGFYAAVVQTRDGEPWRLELFDEFGQPTRSHTIDTPGPRGRSTSLASLAGQSAMSIGGLSGLPWLTDDLVDAPDIRKIQMLPLTTGAESGEPAYPAAVLLHDRDLAPWSDKTLLAVLTSTWGTAIAAASHHEGARVLGEKLAAQSRALAETQHKLAETESMARLGEMASGAAHEMNNPLTVISGRAQMLAGRLKQANDKTAADAIVDASRHLTDLITSLRLVADPPALKLSDTPIDRIIADALAAAVARASSPCLPVARPSRPCSDPAPHANTGQEHTGKMPVPRLELPTPAPILRGDRELLSAALAEVIANALQASNGAPITIRAHTEPPDSRLLISIEDTGAGMSAKALQHAFDPFFSELPAGRRTGLGLTRARRLLELHGGDITLQSQPGRGTTATITVPGLVQPQPSEHLKTAA
jgi:signal transduction histidine kinase/HD-like signal output (HDOD) protein